MGVTNAGGWVKICHFQRKKRYNLKTVQYTCIVSVKSQIGSHMCSIKWRCFRWPYVTTTPKTPQFLHFSLPFISSWWVNFETSYLVYRLIIASPSWRMTKRPWKGRGYVMCHVLNFGAPSISQEWLKLELSNFVQRETISSLAKGITNHPKRGMVLLTWPIFVCTTVELEKILHGTRWTAINNVVPTDYWLSHLRRSMLWWYFLLIPVLLLSACITYNQCISVSQWLLLQNVLSVVCVLIMTLSPKTAEPIQMLFEGQTHVAQRTTCVVHMGATWRIWLNDLCTAAMWAVATISEPVYYHC